MVENFGLHLKHERELRGVALEEIAESTKIHIRFLEALENNDFDKMPGEVFVKGFIRSYAKVIGFDPEELVNVYDESVGKGRKEELGKVEVINEKAQSRKKEVAGYLFWGIALTVLVSLGYLVVDNIIDTNKKQQAERLPAGESLAKPDTPPIASETNPPENTEIDKAENQKEELPMNEEPIAENTQKASPSIKPAAEKPETEVETRPEPAPEMAKVEVKEPEIQDVQPEVQEKEPEVVDVEPAPFLKPSELLEDEKEEPKTLIESVVMQKNSTSPEKPVIIQQVREDPSALALVDQSRSESAETDAKPLHLKIRVQGNSWFNVTVDDSEEEDFIIPGGSSKNVYGTEKIQLTIGNRNGTELFLNDQPIELPLGSSDVIRNFEITANLLE